MGKLVVKKVIEYRNIYWGGYCGEGKLNIIFCWKIGRGLISGSFKGGELIFWSVLVDWFFDEKSIGVFIIGGLCYGL